jgi:hypothetical protein
MTTPGITPSPGSGKSMPSTPPTPAPAESKRVTLTTKNEIKFPFRLWDMLDEAEKEGWEHIICWLPEGDGFRILDANAFAKNVMTRYFTMRHFKSFQRQLSLYSFKRETDGRKRGKQGYRDSLAFSKVPLLTISLHLLSLFVDAYCHPYFCRANRDLCVFVPREKKRPPKNKVSRSSKQVTLTHSRALRSEEVRGLMNSPSVSPFSEDFEISESFHSGGHKVDSFNLRHMLPISHERNFSFLAKGDQTLFQDNRRSLMQQPLNQKPLQPQWQQQQQLEPSQVPPTRPQLPINQKSSNANWIQDHEANLWKFVNGLVVDSSELSNDKNGLAKAPLSFSTDEILSEIASTFNTDFTENGCNDTNISVLNNITLLPSYPFPVKPQKEYI